MTFLMNLVRHIESKLHVPVEMHVFHISSIAYTVTNWLYLLYIFYGIYFIYIKYLKVTKNCMQSAFPGQLFPCP